MEELHIGTEAKVNYIKDVLEYVAAKLDSEMAEEFCDSIKVLLVGSIHYDKSVNSNFVYNISGSIRFSIKSY